MSSKKLIVDPREAFELARKGQPVDADFQQMLAGASLTTAEIVYRLPDHQALLQSYIWQDYDVLPRLPKLTSFLDFWRTNLDGPIYRVFVANNQLLSPREVRMVAYEGRLALH